jgi:hypothetical protein
MDVNVGRDLIVLAPFLLAAEGLILGLVWTYNSWPTPQLLGERHHTALGRLAGAGALAGGWLLITAISLWCEGMIAFGVVHLVLFTLGTTAAQVAFGISLLILGLTPLVWGFVIRRVLHRRTSAQH